MSADVFYLERNDSMSYNTPHKSELTQEMGVIYMALDAVTKFMAKWLDDNLKTLSSDYWNRYVVSALYESQQKTIRDNGAKSLYDLDQPTILSVFLQNKPVLLREFRVDPQLFGYAHSIKDIRNKYFHKNSKPLLSRRFRHDLDTICLFLEGLGAPSEIIDEAKGQFFKESKLTSIQGAVKNPKPSVKTAAIKITVAPSDKMSVSENLSGKAALSKKARPVVNVAKGSPKLTTRMPCEMNRYPHKISDRLRARGIVGFEISTVNGKQASDLFRKADAGKLGYDFEMPDFAIIASRTDAAELSLSDVKEVLDRGFCKQLPKAIELSDDNCLAWFFCEPEMVREQVSSEIRLVAPPTNVGAAIPDWFKRTIGKNDLPYLSVEEVQVTLQLDKCGVARYAKTYSPRTFVEGVTIGKGLPLEFMERISSVGIMKMIDVGCGTGAMAQGVLHGLDRKLKKSCVPHLTLVDGNLAMLEKAKEFLSAREGSRTYFIPRIEYDEVEKIISSAKDCFPDTDYDMIVTSKFLGELACRGIKDVYVTFLQEAMRRLKKGGILALVDIPKHRVELCDAIEKLFGGKVPVKLWEVRPTYVGSESSDAETVVSVIASK